MNTLFIYTLIASFTTLFIGIITVFHNKKSSTSKLFTLISIATIFWGLSNYFSLDPIYFSNITWARLVLFSAIPHIIFFYLFVRNFPHDEFKINKIEIFGIGGIGLILMFLTLTKYIFESLTMEGGSYIPVPGKLMPLFGIFVVVLLISSIVIIVLKYLKAERKDKPGWGSMLLGFILSYFSLIWTNFVLVNTYGDTQYLIYAPLFMLPMVLGTSFAILRYRLLNIKAIATEIIVFVLLSVSLVQVFVSQSTTQFVFNSVLFCVFLLLSIFLIKSVLREVEQREELARLNDNLKELLRQRESLVHLVTHKVKGSFTRSKYIFAGMLDGTFGEISDEIRMRAQQGLDSDNTGIATVDLVLNAANLTSGTIKYDIKPIDLKKIIEESFDEKLPSAESKNLKMSKSLPEKEVKINGDTFWIKEVVNNLIENSIRYTKEGSIDVSLTVKDDKALLSVKDTGVGITEEDKQNLFKEGGRGKNSVKINVDSTGYGLYSVKLILDAHKGRVWCESPGPGKGSTFFVELSLA